MCQFLSRLAVVLDFLWCRAYDASLGCSLTAIRSRERVGSISTGMRTANPSAVRFGVALAARRGTLGKDAANLAIARTNDRAARGSDKLASACRAMATIR